MSQNPILFISKKQDFDLHILHSPGEDSQLVTRQLKEAEGEAELVTQAVTAVRGTMERVVSAWETYNKCLTSLQTWLAQQIQSHTQSSAAETQVISSLLFCQ